MLEPLGIAADTATLLGRASAATRWVIGRALRREPRRRSALFRYPHEGLELIPLSYYVSLGNVPEISVTFYAINYSDSVVTLISATVMQIFVLGGVSLSAIQLAAEYEIEPQAHMHVSCRRSLTEYEARAIEKATTEGAWFSGSVAYVARGTSGKKSLKYGPVSSLAIQGSVQGMLPR